MPTRPSFSPSSQTRSIPPAPGASRDARAALRAEEAPARAPRPGPGERVEADIVELNLSFLHVARELSRSARELAITRLGLEPDVCAALERLSVADLHALAHSHALIFSLRLDGRDLAGQAELARFNPVASEARLVLARDAV